MILSIFTFTKYLYKEGCRILKDLSKIVTASSFDVEDPYNKIEPAYYK